MSLNPPIILPNTFVNGTVADANQVNANFNALLTGLNNNTRTILPVSTSFYVAPSGADVPGNGLTPAAPAATIQFIINLLQDSYDLSGLPSTSSVFILLAPGSYTQSPVINGRLVGQMNPPQLTIMPQSGAVAISGDPCFNISNGAAVAITGNITLSSGVSQCIISQHAANVQFNGLTFGAAVGAHLYAARTGTIQSTGNYTIAGGAAFHAQANAGQIFIQQLPADYNAIPTGTPTVTLTGTPAFTDFLFSQHCGVITATPTWVGGATGAAYLANLNGVIETQSTSLPSGLSGGSTATGGQFH